jgi:hypothetical protein
MAPSVGEVAGAKKKGRLSRVGKMILGTIFCLFLLGVFVSLTWSIGLWLVGGSIAFILADDLKRRSGKMPSKSTGGRFRAKLLDGVREVLGRLLLALALVTFIQLIVNVVVWLFANRRADDALGDWLVRNQGNVATLRAGLVHLLRPRLALSIMVVALLAGTIRPSWRLVDRYLGARRYTNRVLQVMTAIVSVTFVTTEYAASYDRAFAESRVTLIEKERAEGEKQKRRMAGAEWLRDTLQRSTPAERTLYREYIAAWPKQDPRDVASAEADALRRRWASADTTPEAGRAGTTSIHVAAPETAAPRSTLPEVRRSSLWRKANDFFNGPGDSTPPYSAWELEHGVTATLKARARQARRAAVETANVVLGEMNPEGLVEAFVEALEEAASDTFIPRWLTWKQARADASNPSASAPDQSPGDARESPQLAEAIEAEVGHRVGVVPSARQATELRARLRMREFVAASDRMNMEIKQFGRLMAARNAEGSLEGSAELEEAAESVSRRLTPWEVIEEAAPKVWEVIERDTK